ncbi:helix-turn-helix domain-containing protein [Aliamphritea spongicola]|uniref:helix-turn-helix domain-containing protein n=1 Tax=Aliamphritea spongicola TaxID=707589 RepID=UPI00196BA603|nr:helix-turn-helix domain-containing protein [Aliamphritea spongicola]MBN3562502.1 helix-turn-helix domain-containing protein [Aliamphritea spongicola]
MAKYLQDSFSEIRTVATPAFLHNTPQIARIQQALNYIEANLDQPLTVDTLAEKSCWSRWQFQRVFMKETGMSVAQYVRGIRLSTAARLLLTTPRRHLDIALSCGFESEISFNRSFRKEYECTPGTYRKRGVFQGLRQPLSLSRPDRIKAELPPKLLQVKIETRPSFELQGVRGYFNGLFSAKPNYEKVIPEIWMNLARYVPMDTFCRFDNIGVIDLNTEETANNIPYWACFENPAPGISAVLQTIRIPEQTYAVIPYKGHIKDFDKTLEWFLFYWLPESGYQGINGFDLELYGRNFDPGSDDAYMEYWVPVKLADKALQF